MNQRLDRWLKPSVIFRALLIAASALLTANTTELAEAERSRVLEQLLSDALPVKGLENGELVLPLLPLPADYLEAGPLSGLVYEDFPELSRVIHALASATVETLTLIEELSNA